MGPGQELADREQYPSDASPIDDGADPAEGEASAQSQVQNTRPPGESAPAGREAGMANDQHEGRPTARGGESQRAKRESKTSVATGTPGGGLGTPDEAELKRDPQTDSSKHDDRMSSDDR